MEILTSKSAKGPSRDWLNICKSNQAKSKIKQWFKKEKREENIVRGKASFESELHRLNVSMSVLQDEELLQTLLRKLSFDNIDDLYASIGYGGLTAGKAVGKIKEDLLKASRANVPAKEPAKPEAPQPVKLNRHADSGVIVEDIDSCMIKFSRCCTPVPGDDIVGFITKGYGVSIHRRDCPNAQGVNDPSQMDRWVRVSWCESEDKPFATTLEVLATDRDGLLLDIAAVMTSQRLRMKEIFGKDLPNGLCQFTVTFEVRSTDELNTCMGRIRSISGVRNVKRGKN